MLPLLTAPQDGTANPYILRSLVPAVGAQINRPHHCLHSNKGHFRVFVSTRREGLNRNHLHHVQRPSQLLHPQFERSRPVDRDFRPAAAPGQRAVPAPAEYGPCACFPYRHGRCRPRLLDAKAHRRAHSRGCPADLHLTVLCQTDGRRDLNRPVRSRLCYAVTAVAHVGRDPGSGRSDRVTVCTVPTTGRPGLIGRTQPVVFHLYAADANAACTIGHNSKPSVVVPVSTILLGPVVTVRHVTVR